MSETLVQIGAGAIGRSFIAQLFSSAGYEVVFVDIDEELVAELNRRRNYEVVIRSGNRADCTIQVSPVRAISARDGEAAARALEECSVAATAVGEAGLESAALLLAEGVRRRAAAGAALDIILAENVAAAAERVREVMERSLDAPTVARYCGLVETSIGKMVPLVPAAERQRDPLVLYAEPYNTLIADGTAFRNKIPAVPELMAVHNIKAYVDRKLFIHNLGHAATAYLSYVVQPSVTFVADALEHSDVGRQVEAAMAQSASALAAAYPEVFTARELADHIEDLLQRFRNRALGDTVFRVGRDLPRKLSRDDRVLGAIFLAATHGTPYVRLAEVAAAGFHFLARDEENRPDPRDLAFHEHLRAHGAEGVLRDICGLDPARGPDAEVHGAILEAYHRISHHR